MGGRSLLYKVEHKQEAIPLMDLDTGLYSSDYFKNRFLEEMRRTER